MSQENSILLFPQATKRVEIYYDFIHIDTNKVNLKTLVQLQHFKRIIKDILRMLSSPKMKYLSVSKEHRQELIYLDKQDKKLYAIEMSNFVYLFESIRDVKRHSGFPRDEFITKELMIRAVQSYKTRLETVYKAYLIRYLHQLGMLPLKYI